MIRYIKYGGILRYMFLSDYIQLDAAEEDDHLKCPLYNAEAADIGSPFIEFFKDPFC